MTEHFCFVPAFLNVWTLTKAEKSFDPNVYDVDTCWRGMGYSACDNNRGYWYNPSVPCCKHWENTYPVELLEQIIGKHDPLTKLVKEETNIVFSSKT